jgi:hypothetical protein
MIALGIILLIIGIFVARNILWPLGGILIIVGVVLAIANHGLVYY